jgi:alpha-D-ribose 1-methylphosphonate 5-triphosphate synthase subunit PhnH
MITEGNLLPGYADPVLEAQETFRAALHAVSYPGRIMEAGFSLDPPAPIHKAAAALALALFDFETPVWLDPAASNNATENWLRFHCGCPFVADPADAQFAVIADPESMPPLSWFREGTDEAPETAATLIVQAARFFRGSGGMRLTGPGIQKEVVLLIDGVPGEFWKKRDDAIERFPRGIDLFLTDEDRLIGLPRTTLIKR